LRAKIWDDLLIHGHGNTKLKEQKVFDIAQGTALFDMLTAQVGGFKG
jgi:hypothetical protein